MQLSRGMELFLVASILCCSVLGHPSQAKDNDVSIRSVKSSSGRSAFESETESEKSSSVTEVQKDGDDFTSTRFSDYEASAASESSHSSTNSESEFIAIDSDNDGDVSAAKSNKRAESSSSSSSSKSKTSKTEFEQEVKQDGGYSANDDLDLEMSYASASEKSEKSSSSASSSYKSDSLTSIDEGTDSVLQKSSSSFNEEKEFESEMQEKSFTSKNIEYSADESSQVEKKFEDSAKSISSTAQQQNMSTRSGALENSITKDSKTVPSTKKPTQSTKNVAKIEKPLKTSQKTAVTGEGKKSSKPKISSIQNKKVEEASLNTSESEMKASSEMTTTTVGVNEISSEVENNNLLGYKSSGPVPSLVETPLLDTNSPSTPKGLQEEITLTAQDTKSVVAEQKLTENELAVDVKNNLTSNIQTENQVQEQMAASETKESVQEITATTVNKAPCTPEISTSSLPCKLPAESIQPQIEVPGLPQTCTSEIPTLPQIPTSPSLQPQAPLTSGTVGIPPVLPSTAASSTAASTVQATSASSETISSEKQLTDTTAQYNISPELNYPHLKQDYYGSPYSQYPMYSYEKSPFLAPLDQFPYGQPEHPPCFSQPPNMNYPNYPPLNFFPLGFVPVPYPLYAYPPGCNPFCPPQPTYLNGPASQYPDRYPLEYPPTSTLPTSQSSPIIPKSAIENSVTDNLLPNPVADTLLPTLPCTSSLSPTLQTELPAPDVVSDIKQRELEAIENLTTTPTLGQPPLIASPATEILPAIPALPQKPLTPSQEIMINNHLPSYIIEDLEARFEEAKTSILQKYTVYPEDKTEFIEMAEEQTLSYDYLVLGTHVSGLTALKTLTETGKRVLILDNARLPPCETYSPYHRLRLIDSSYVTSYSAIAQKTEIEKKIHVSKVVGGPLSYDMGVWDHGSLHKYEQWSQTCQLWSWEKISSYFKELENVEEICYLNGPINVSYNVPECSLADQIIRSFEEAGIQNEKYELDAARTEPGLIYLPSMYDSKTSMTFAEKMFAEVKGKENLHMALGLEAVKIVFESERAVGVEVVTAGGKSLVIRATEEVIVSYGVVNTVKLLQNSGFGDAALLQQYQIPVIRDLPQLGSDVLLYPMYAGVFIRCSRGTLLDTLDSDISALGYAFKDTTVQTSVATSFYKAFLQVQGTTGSEIQINIHTFSSRTIERLMYFMKGLFNFNQEMIDFVLEEVSDHDIMFLVPQLLDVEKRAQISISSADYKAQPIIDTHLYESDKDLLMMQKTLNHIRKISRTSVFREIGGEIVQVPVKNCGKADFSKEFNLCSIRELTVASLHLTGGAAMGVDEKISVVDEELRLRGTQNVHLLNPAVIPNGVSADSSAISSVIGRFGADIIVKKVL